MAKDTNLEQEIAAEYQRFRSRSRELGAPPEFLAFCDAFADAPLWKSYSWLLDLVGEEPFHGTAIDIGCKYGHTLPLFLKRGFDHAVGIDVDASYIDLGARYVSATYPAISFGLTDEGYLSLPSNSAEFIQMNEVISHVNPAYLQTLYAEAARVLKPGGRLLISDGNNIANDACRRDLINVYDAWENGPEGRDTGRDVVTRTFRTRRQDLIRAWYPQMPGDKIDYLAANTSGLFGDHFRAVVDKYVASGTLVERPYRPGTCPADPGPGGTVMEWGFHPRAVELDLANFGIEARQLDPPPPIRTHSAKALLGSIVQRTWHHALRTVAPQSYRGASWGFQVLGVKR